MPGRLGDLQFAILLRAADNLRNRGDDGVAHVYGCDVAAAYFGWPESKSTLCRRPPGVTAAAANRVHASICRAFRRMEERGLGERVSGRLTLERWSGFRLNDQGMEKAAAAARLDGLIGRMVESEGEQRERVASLVELLNSRVGRN